MRKAMVFAVSFVCCALALPALGLAGKVKVRNCSTKASVMVYSYNGSDNPRTGAARDKKRANKNGDRVLVKCSAVEKKCSIKVVFKNPGNTNKWTYYKRKINGTWTFNPTRRYALRPGNSCN